MTDRTEAYEVAYDCWSRMFSYDNYANYVDQIEGAEKLTRQEYNRLYEIWTEQYEERMDLWYEQF